MNCRDALRLLSLRMDGELEPKREPGLAEHLAECGSCRKAESVYAGIREHYAGMSRPDAPTDMSTRVRGALRERTAPVLTLVPLLRVVVAAASIVLLVSVAATYMIPRPAPSTSAPGKIALDASDLLLTKLAEAHAPAVLDKEEVR